MTPLPPLAVRRAWRRRLALLGTRRVLGKALLAAVLVGSLLVVWHQGDVIVRGQITGCIVLTRQACAGCNVLL